MDYLLTKLVERILIQQSAEWNVCHAKIVVKCVLVELAKVVDTDEFRRLVASVFRVGRTIEREEGPEKPPQWNLDKVKGTLRESDVLQNVDEYPDFWIHELAVVIKSCNFAIPQRIDWIEMISRIYRRVCPDRPVPDLYDRLAVSIQIESVIAARVSWLAEQAALKMEISVGDVVEALRGAYENYSVNTVRKFPPDTELNQRKLPLTEREVDLLIGLVAHPVRTDFQRWIKSIPVACQHSLFRRVNHLSVDPVANRIWVKQIKDPGIVDLLECKVVSADIHYRILFKRTANDGIEILAFGLRRDLDQLIEKAKKLSSVDLSNLSWVSTSCVEKVWAWRQQTVRLDDN